MSIIDLYSKRNGNKDESLVYNYIPVKLKNQVFHTWDGYLNQKVIAEKLRISFWDLSMKLICQEHGFGRLIYDNRRISKDSQIQVELYYNGLREVPEVLDIIEAIFLNLDKMQNFLDSERLASSISLKSCIADLNKRFSENNFGFRYEQGKIIKIESEILFQEAIKPAFNLINNKTFAGANDEFLSAQGHFRSGSYESCINECEKAYESVLKTICHEKGWQYSQEDTAKPLTKKIIDNKLVPDYFIDSLLNVATIRNKVTAHGKGVIKFEVPEYLAAYAINQTASVIKYLVESFNKSNDS